MNDDHSSGRRPPPGVSPPEAKPARRRISSAELFAGAREIVIEHEGRVYQLRITQYGKLILTA